MGQTETLKILAIGLDPDSRAVVGKALPANQIIDQPCDLEKLMDQPVEPPPAIVCCGVAPEVSLTEVAQALRMQYQSCPIYLLTTVRVGFERKVFQKNGFTDAFLLPLEAGLLETQLRDDLAKASNGAIRSYRAVKLIDLAPDEILDFDTFIYMPVNGKHIRYSNAGDSLDQERTAKLSKSSVANLHVATQQIEKFYQFTANQLRKIGSSATMGETEKREKMQGAIRDLMGGLFNDSTKEASTSHGKAIIADCQEIVKAYIVAGSTQQMNWFEKIMAVAGSGSNSYSHAANVATYAALFSMASGIGKPEELGIAGILHDIGLADIPEEVQKKDPSEWTPEEKATYETHPDLSIKLIKERKLIVSETVLKAVQQHHEHHSGTGYPKGRSGKQITPEAQIVGIADYFDYLTTSKDGKPTLSPVNAFKQIRKENSSNPSLVRFDPEIINKLSSIFPPES